MYDREEASSTRWYIIDIGLTAYFDGYWCLCYEGNHLVDRIPFNKKMEAVEYGEGWMYNETD